MKKLLIILIGLIFVLSMAGLASAQEKAKPATPAEATKSAEPAKPTEAAKAEGAKPEEAKKEAPAKPVKFRMGGIITGIDAAAKKITIKQCKVKRERIFTLTMSKKVAKEISGLKVGDLVNVWVTGKMITALQRVY